MTEPLPLGTASPEPPFLRDTRAAYDAVADDYAERLEAEPGDKPLARAVLGAFAELVARDGGGPVADVGSGPGQVTAHLAALGVDVFGVDLSPAMVALARRAYPELRFDEGSMTALDLADGSLAGLVAWYSVIHIDPGHLPAVFAGFHRVLAPGGHLLLTFQAGDEPVRVTQAWGHAVSLTAHRLSPDRVKGLLVQAGFETRADLVREPEGTEKVPQAHLLARRPAAS